LYQATDRAPTLREALEKAKERGLLYLMLDGTVAADLCAEKKAPERACTFRRRSQPAGSWTRTRNPQRAATLAALPGQRGFALRWVTRSPRPIGGIAKAALVLVQFEHKMIS
jgi:hypothetical protein